MTFPDSIENPVLRGKDATDTSAIEVADPFLFEDNGVYYMFFEIVETSNQQGAIAYATSNDGLNWQYQQIIIREPFHLSYPQIFRHNGEIYMVPESYEADEVRLYRATNFPTQWQFESVLIDNQALVDSTLFFHDSRWWMFSSVTSNDQLFLYYADNLTGPWTPHAQNPLISGNANIARPAGKVIDYQGNLYRLAQDDTPVYGEKVLAFRIDQLTTTNYSETEIPQSPLFDAFGTDWAQQGIHHFDPILLPDGSYLGVVDGYGTPLEPPLLQVPEGSLLNKSNWTLQSVDSEETSGEDGAATNAFDSNPNSFWHTEWSSSSPSHPHEIQINLGSVFNITGLSYLPRQDGGVNGRVGNFEVLVSSDGVNWILATQETFADRDVQQTVAFTPLAGQFISLRALNSTSNGPFTAIAELAVYGLPFSGNYPPIGNILTPQNDLTVIVGESVSFSASGSDPDNNTPLSYNWNFGAGSGIADSNLQNPGNIQFDSLGSHTVTLTVTDSLGTQAITPSTRTISVVENLPTTLDKLLWQLLYVDSEETSGENGAATNAFDSNTSTIWHTEWLNNQTGHPHELSIDLGGFYDVTALHYLPRQDGSSNGRVGDYEIYATTTLANWGQPVATGTFLSIATQQTVSFNPTPARYIRLVSLSDPNGGPFTSIAEINVEGTAYTGNLPPNVVIESPSGDVTIAQGESVDFAATAVDPDNDSPITYLWNFGGSGVADNTSLSPGAITFDTIGTHTVTFTATDPQNNSSSSAVTVTVIDPNVPVRLDKSGWRIVFVDSEETSGEDGAASNVIDNNPSTIWHTRWSSGQTSHPHEIQIDMGTNFDISSF